MNLPCIEMKIRLYTEIKYLVSMIRSYKYHILVVPVRSNIGIVFGFRVLERLLNTT